MNNKNFALVLVILISIGLFALPSTMSLFAGQHSFYNIDSTGNQIPCVKCHGDVKAELSANAPHAAFKCEYCHRIEQGAASGDNAYAQVPYVDANGNAMRAIVISVADMEAGNFPAVINGSDVFISNKTLAGVTLLHGNGIISATTTDITLTVGSKANFRITSTYDSSGNPKDLNPTTRNTGLDLSKAVITAVNTNGRSVTVNLNNSGSKVVNPGSAYHAASLVSCMECHGGEEPMGHYTRVTNGTVCSDCHYGGGGVEALGNRMTTLEAGGFGLTGISDDTGANEAHNAWVKTDDGINRFGGPNGFANNGACIGCHTHVATNITYNKKTTIVMEVTQGNDGVYTIDSVVTGGSTKTYSVGN